MKPIILASQSPRRAELLQQIAVPFEVWPVDVDESVAHNESAEDYVCRVAKAKAIAAVAQKPGQLILAADTSVVLAGAILGKPQDAAHARQMLLQLSGRTHQVLTAVVVANDQKNRIILNTSDVTMISLNKSMIEHYVRSGEPMDKAGAYGIQGLAGAFVAHIRGSYSAVMGLPLADSVKLLHQFGIDVPASWSSP